MALHSVAGAGERLTAPRLVGVGNLHRGNASVVPRDELQQALGVPALVHVRDEGTEQGPADKELDMLGRRRVHELIRDESASCAFDPREPGLLSVDFEDARAADDCECDLDVAHRQWQEYLHVVPCLGAVALVPQAVQVRHMHCPRTKQVARHLQHRLRLIRSPGALAGDAVPRLRGLQGGCPRLGALLRQWRRTGTCIGNSVIPAYRLRRRQVVGALGQSAPWRRPRRRGRKAATTPRAPPRALCHLAFHRHRGAKIGAGPHRAGKESTA
mmetsp:Transcript_76521/g.222260  ORF Transcript_76521/g.222260 Transcript_76521/m.222260 type:complete len:271 (-) Transcript_76521:1-813(-)